jgi:AN1-type zinc finger and ubiquitin domain-containing protein 1
MIVKCRCDKLVCIDCRYPEDHMCSFNYKEEGRELLIKNNEKVVASKIQKI